LEEFLIVNQDPKQPGGVALPEGVIRLESIGFTQNLRGLYVME